MAFVKWEIHICLIEQFPLIVWADILSVSGRSSVGLGWSFSYIVLDLSSNCAQNCTLIQVLALGGGNNPF